MTKEQWEESKKEQGSSFDTCEDYRRAVDGILSMLGQVIEVPTETKDST